MIDGRYSGEVAEQFDEQAKRDFAVSVATDLGVELRHCAAIGDGWSDGNVRRHFDAKRHSPNAGRTLRSDYQIVIIGNPVIQIGCSGSAS